MENFNQNNQIQIELSDEMAQGTYSNLAIISHSTSEFVIDFVRIMPGIQQAKVKSRVILTPEHAKRLLFAMKENIDKFEKTFGTIQMPSEQQGGGFMPPIVPIGNMGQA